MIEFEQKYSTPRAQRQYELETLIKHYEVERAENIRRLLFSIGVGFAYVLLMGGVIGYGTFAGGYAVLGWLSVITVGLFIAGEFVKVNAELSRPNLNHPERFIQS